MPWIEPRAIDRVMSSRATTGPLAEAYSLRRPRTPGDLTIRWTRRSRALSADSWGAVEAALAEESEAYEVEILDGATVKRVLPSTVTSAIYTGAQQTADWGVPLGPGDTLDLRIFQLSALVGRGAPKTVTLIF